MRHARAVSRCSVSTLQGTAFYVASAGHFAGTATVTGAQLATPPSWNTGSIGNQVLVYGTYGGTNSVIYAAGTYTIGFTYQWCSPAISLPLGIVPYRQP